MPSGVARFALSTAALGLAAGPGCARYRWADARDVPAVCPPAPPAPPPRALAPPRPVPAAVPGPASLVGFVFDTAGAPVRAASVDAEGGPTGLAVTDSAGRFELAGLAVGTHALVVRRLGYTARRDEFEIPMRAGVALEMRAQDIEFDGMCSGLIRVRVRQPWWRVW